MDLPQPVTREHMFLAVAAGMSGIRMPEPKTIKELFLQKIAYTYYWQETISSPLDFSFSSDGTNLSDYTIYGNTGGVGVSKNLFDKDNADIVELYPNQSNGTAMDGASYQAHSIIVPLSQGKYTFSMYQPSGSLGRNRSRFACFTDYPQIGDNPIYLLDRVTRDGDVVYTTFTAPPNTAYVMIFLWNGSDYPVNVINDIVANNNIMLEYGFEHSTYAAYNSSYCIPVVLKGDDEILNNVTSQEINGLTVTRNGDGSLTFNGTATASTNFFLKNDSHTVGDYYQIEKDRYYISGSPQGAASNKYIMSYRYIAENSESSTIARVPSGGDILDNTNGDRNTIAPYIAVWSGITCNNVTFNPELRKIKMVNIPISEKLNYGSSVSFTEAETPIPTFAGVNIFSVDSEIKPYNVKMKGHIQFISSDEIPETISDSWEEIIENCNSGAYADKYHIGDTKIINFGSEGYVSMEIVAFDTDVLSNSDGKAHITWISKNCLKTRQKYNPAHEIKTVGTGTIGGWEHSEMRQYLREVIWPMIPYTIRKAIKAVDKYTVGYNSEESEETNMKTSDTIWIPSYKEVYSASYSKESENVSYSEAFPDNNTRIKNMDGTATTWNLRSANTPFYTYYITLTGVTAYTRVDLVKSVAIGFCT